MGFSSVSSGRDNVILKSESGIVVAYNDGNYEGFIKKTLKETKFELLGALTILGLSMLYFTTDITIVDGPSMIPTYHNYQIIIKSRSARDVNKIMVSYNSIVKFKSPQGDQAIKRVWGVPGDEVEFDLQTVRINGKVVDTGNTDNINKFLKPGQSYEDNLRDLRTKKTFKLKENEYFVMGDNRDESVDSRTYGPIIGGNIVSVIEK